MRHRRIPVIELFWLATGSGQLGRFGLLERPKVPSYGAWILAQGCWSMSTARVIVASSRGH
jgi:hypothetical protein